LIAAEHSSEHGGESRYGGFIDEGYATYRGETSWHPHQRMACGTNSQGCCAGHDSEERHPEINLCTCYWCFSFGTDRRSCCGSASQRRTSCALQVKDCAQGRPRHRRRGPSCCRSTSVLDRQLGDCEVCWPCELCFRRVDWNRVGRAKGLAQWHSLQGDILSLQTSPRCLLPAL